MKAHWRKLASLLPPALERKLYKSYFEKEYQQWIKANQLLPVPHLIKQNLIKKVARETGARILVETGTYLGDMIFAMQPHFTEIFSIELAAVFYAKAQKRFRKAKHIQLLSGDSGEVLARLVPQLNEKALFWLDGHYSGGLTAKGKLECPVFQELECIFSSPIPHSIVIDDARLFVGQKDYPTLTELEEFARSKRQHINLNLENDTIIITYQ